MRGQREHARRIRLFGGHQRVPAVMHAHRCVLVIIQARAPHAGIFERKSQWFDQMQLRAGIGAQANHIAGVRRDFGFDKDDVEHGLRTQKPERSLTRTAPGVTACEVPAAP